jgi:hypothetical protein
MPPDYWTSCPVCKQTRRVWAPGAPLFGCTITLSDRFPGEIVTLGNGDHGRILWHMPRKTKKVNPECTFLGLIEEFTGVESYSPIFYPSCVGVASVDVPRVIADDKAHDRDRDLDYGDPIHRQIAGRLI